MLKYKKIEIYMILINIPNLKQCRSIPNLVLHQKDASQSLILILWVKNLSCDLNYKQLTYFLRVYVFSYF